MWTIIEDSFQPEALHHKETLFTIGNGYLATRGTFEETFPDDCRTTFIHGVFDDVPVFFTELASAPDWLPLEIYLDGERFSLDSGTINRYSRSLDLRSGTLRREVSWISPSGKGMELVFERFASLADEHLLYLRCQFTPEVDGTLEIRASINGNVDNLGFIHWQDFEQGELEDCLYMRSQTVTTAIRLAMAMRLESSKAPDQEQYLNTENQPTQVLTISALHGEAIQVEKVVAIATSRDTEDPFNLAVEHVRKSPGWEQAYTANKEAWREDWERMDIMIEGDDEAQLAIRAHLFQLFIAAPRHDERVNIGAKTLSGYGYRGHSFWDTEIFMLPVFIYTAPHIARNLLNYRYQRLEATHKKARENGFQGAQFPWESADSGEEVTPRWVPSYTHEKTMVRIWTGDIEIHISADIAYATHLYWKTTGDDEWFIEKGAELILDTAKFWASRAEWDEKADRYEYNDVIGPDEYHDHIDNNFYTNYMARWNLKTALEVLEWLEAQAPSKARELVERLGLSPELLEAWNDVMRQIYLPVSQGGVIEQFEGYFQLKDIDLAALEPRKISAQEYFGIEGVSETQIIKQPDVLMLLYLMRDEFNDEQVRMNYDYYTPRTDVTFGSSLGPSIMAALTCRMRDCTSAYHYFITAANADMKDVRGNAGDGIHGASAGGLWQSVVFGFAGLEVGKEKWEIHPCLPAQWKRLTFHFTYHGKVETVDIRNS